MKAVVVALHDMNLQLKSIAERAMKYLFDGIIYMFIYIFNVSMYLSVYLSIG